MLATYADMLKTWTDFKMWTYCLCTLTQTTELLAKLNVTRTDFMYETFSVIFRVWIKQRCLCLWH